MKTCSPSSRDSLPGYECVLASAIESGADMLATGDQDLLAVADVSQISIVDPRSCWERLRAGL